MPYAKINDHRIYYETYGKGEPLIMIMGLGADTNCWSDKLIQELSKQYRVIIFDNRGAGKSDPAKAPYTIRDLANDVIKLMQTLSVEKAHILGVSMGGMIAQEIAINYPSKVNKLILVVTSPGGPNSIPPKHEALQQLMMDRSTTTIKEIAEKLIYTLFTKEYIKSYKNGNRNICKKSLTKPNRRHTIPITTKCNPTIQHI